MSLSGAERAWGYREHCNSDPKIRKGTLRKKGKMEKRQRDCKEEGLRSSA